jgi:hypothetical protein
MKKQGFEDQIKEHGKIVYATVMPDKAREVLEQAGYEVLPAPDLARAVKRGVKIGKTVTEAIENALGTTVTRLSYVRADQEILVGLHYTDDLADDGEDDV